MNKRTEKLEKIALLLKRKKVSKKHQICILTITLLLMHLASAVKKLISNIAHVIWENMFTFATCVFLGLLICVMFISYETGDDISVKNENTGTEFEATSVSVASSGELCIYGDASEEKINEEDKLYTDKNGNVHTSGEIVLKTSDTEGYTAKELHSMKFYIRVNRQANCVTVYTTDENGEFTVPIKAMICSTGGEGTPLGVYSTNQKYIFRKLLYDVYGQYATRIYGQILFHSVSYSSPEKDALLAEEYNKLGEAASHGCIRLTTEDAKWIYDYCKLGTGVEIYDDEDPGPLGKPVAIKIPEASVWDPTDIEDDNNPWNDKTPIIQAEDIHISKGTQFDVIQYISAVDTCGNDISSEINVNGFVNTGEAGTYELKLSVMDLLNRSSEKTINVIVEGNE